MRIINAVIQHPATFILGAREFRSSCGMTYGDSRDEAYDFGREAAHIATLRRYEA